MDSIWEAVLASSVVSTLLSTLISGYTVSKSEKRQKNVAAQMLARALEGYAKECAAEIEATDVAVSEAERQLSYDPLSKRDVPTPNFDFTGLDRLDASWRDRIAAFPDTVTAEKRSLAAQWLHEDQFDFMSLLQEAEAKLGQAAINLAIEIRNAHGLPTEHAAQECSDAQNIFAKVEEQKRQCEERMAENNKSIYASLPVLMPESHQNSPAGSADRSQL